MSDSASEHSSATTEGNNEQIIPWPIFSNDHVLNICGGALDPVSNPPTIMDLEAVETLHEAIEANWSGEHGDSVADAHDVRKAYAYKTWIEGEFCRSRVGGDPSLRQILHRLGRIDRHMVRFGGRLDQVDARLDQVNARLDQVDAGLGRVDGRLGAMEASIGRVEQDVGELVRKAAREMNSRRGRGVQHPYEIIKFLDGNPPPNQLPRLSSAATVGQLTLDQLQTYLEGYGLTAPNAPRTRAARRAQQAVRKKQLAVFIGCRVPL